MIGITPVVDRELRVALFRRGARQRWMDTVWTAGLVTLVILVLKGFAGGEANGRLLFHLLFLGGCYAVVTGGIRITSDLFSEERRNGTLGLLVLTGLRPLEIFVSKLAGAWLTMLYRVGSGLPFLAVSFVMGGVQFNQFAGAAAYLLALLLLCTALGTFGSVLHRDGGSAQVTGMGLVGLVTAVPWAVHWLTEAARTGPRAAGMDWRGLSPIYGAMEIFGGFPGGVDPFWSSLAGLVLLALLALVAGAAVLHGTWREEAPAWAARALGAWQRW